MDLESGGGWLDSAVAAYGAAMRGGGGEPALRVIASVLAQVYRSDGALARLDPWLDALDREVAPFGAHMPPLCEPHVFIAAPAVLARRPAYPGLPLWYARAVARLKAPGDADFRLAAAAFAFEFALRGGDFRELDAIVATARGLADGTDTPLRLDWLEAEALHAWLCAEHRRARDVVETALALGGGHAIHVQSLSAALSAGDVPWGARAYADAMRSLDPRRPQDVAHLEFLAAGLALLSGDGDRARAHISACTNASVAGAPPYFATLWLLGRAHVRCATGDLRGARRDVGRVLAATGTHYWRFLHFSALATRAWLELRADHRAEAADALTQALGMARAHGYRNCDPWWDPSAWNEVAAFAQRVEHDVPTLAGLLARRNA